MSHFGLPPVGAVAPARADAPAPEPSGPAPGVVGFAPRIGGPDPRAQGRDDLATLRAIVEGRLPASEGLHRIAMSGGFPIVAEGRTVFVAEGPGAVAGDFAGWQPQPLVAQGPLHILEVEGALRGGYKLVSPDGQWRADPWSRAYAHDEHGEISRIRPEGAHLARFPMMSGFGLPPRTVRVHVPTGAPTHHLYMQDGQNLFDPKAMFGGWRVDEAAGPNTLVIGVDNTGMGRFDEYTPTTDVVGGEVLGGRADDYAKLLLQVIKPRIEATYGPAKKTGILGSSLGGLVAFHVAAEHPTAFDFVGAMSATFGWGRMGEGSANPTMLERYRGLPRRRRPRFYIDSGGAPGGRDNYDVTREMESVLSASGYRHGKELWHWHEPDAAHRESAWAARVFRPLHLFETL